MTRTELDKEEIDSLDKNIEAAYMLESTDQSYQLIQMLLRVKDVLLNKKTPKRVKDTIYERLPLLCLQINVLKKKSSPLGQVKAA